MLKNKSTKRVNVQARNRRKFSSTLVNEAIKRRFKKYMGVEITSTEINKIWNDWIEENIITPLSVGTVVQIDKDSKIWVKATPIYKHKRAMSLLSKGKVYRNGTVVDADINFDSSRYIYKVVYENKKFKGETKLFYKAHKAISKAVNEGIINGKLITRF